MVKKNIQISIIFLVLLVVVLFFGKNIWDKHNAQNTRQENSTSFRDGTYNGSIENAVYGNLQVQATVKDGKLVEVTSLEYPNDTPTSDSINKQALPLLEHEAITNQNANVDIITGASDSSPAFGRSLDSALKQAQL
jgi:uncharacterized protein with FMN-binding domain